MSKKVHIFKKIYLSLSCLIMLGLIYMLTGISEKYSQDESVELIFPLLVCITAYYGLKYKTKWAIPLLLITAVFMILSTFINILRPANDLFAFINKIVDLVFVMFYGYQIFFFSKKEVKQYFGVKGTVIF
jgi:hypothetical protein